MWHWQCKDGDVDSDVNGRVRPCLRIEIVAPSIGLAAEFIPGQINWATLKNIRKSEGNGIAKDDGDGPVHHLPEETVREYPQVKEED